MWPKGNIMRIFLEVLQERWNQGLIAGKKKDCKQVQNTSSTKLKFIMGRPFAGLPGLPTLRELLAAFLPSPQSGFPLLLPFLPWPLIPGPACQSHRVLLLSQLSHSSKCCLSHWQKQSLKKKVLKLANMTEPFHLHIPCVLQGLFNPLWGWGALLNSSSWTPAFFSNLWTTPQWELRSCSCIPSCPVPFLCTSPSN